VGFYHLRFHEALESGQAALALARHVDDLVPELIALFHIVRSLDSIGDLAGVRQQAAAMLDAAERLRHRDWLARTFWLSGSLSYHGGNLQEARAYMDRGLLVLPGDPALQCSRTVLEHEAGDFVQGAVYVERLLDATHRSPMGVQFA